MKKAIALFLLASLLLLAGCSKPSETNTTMILGEEMDYGYKTSDYEAYVNYIEDYIQRDLPLSNKLITAEQLSVLGSWKSFSLEWGEEPEKSKNGQWYVYWLEAPGVSYPVAIQVNVHHQPEQAFAKKVIADYVPAETLSAADYEHAESMAQLQSKDKSFKIERDDVTYLYYQNGKLDAVLIEVDGILYDIHEDDLTFNGTSQLLDLDKTSVLARLLSLDEATAKAAYEEIKAALTK